MKLFLIGILMTVSGSLNASAQSTESSNGNTFVTYVSDDRYYCLTEPLLDVLIVSYREKEIISDQVLNLKSQLQQKDIQLGLHSNIDNLSEGVIAAKDSSMAAVKESRELTKKELRKERRKRVSDWFKSRWQIIVSSAAALGAGYGIASIPK